jgi:hypothetical protein
MTILAVLISRRLLIAAAAGNQYLIEISGYVGSQGKGFINISCEVLFGQEKPGHDILESVQC